MINFARELAKRVVRFVFSIRIWKEFKGQKNSPDVIIKKADALAKHLTQSAYDIALIHLQNNDKHDITRKEDIQNNFFTMFLEVVYFLLHAVSINKYTYLYSTNERIIFLDRLLHGVHLIVSEMPRDQAVKNQIKNIFVDEYSARHEEYGSYAITQGPDNSLAGTLLWEYGKKISKKVSGSESSALINHEAVTYAIASINAMHLKKLLSGK